MLSHRPTPDPLPLQGLQDWTKIDANRQRQNRNHADECFLCGRGLTQKAVDGGSWIHLRTDNQLQPVAIDLETVVVDGVQCENPLDQGWFPVGSECAKRVPLAFRKRLNLNKEA